MAVRQAVNAHLMLDARCAGSLHSGQKPAQKTKALANKANIAIIGALLCIKQALTRSGLLFFSNAGVGVNSTATPVKCLDAPVMGMTRFSPRRIVNDDAALIGRFQHHIMIEPPVQHAG